MLARMLGALTLNRSTYKDVEHDSSATWQAMLIVIAVSIAGGIGGLLAGDTDLVRGVIFGVIRGVMSWAVWAGAVWLVGTTLLKTPETQADWGQLARGTGFAQTPGLLNILVFIPVVSGIISLVVFCWQIAGMLMAVRESLDYNSLWRAFFVVLIAFIPVAIISGLIFWGLGILDLNESKEAPTAMVFAFVGSLIG